MKKENYLKIVSALVVIVGVYFIYDGSLKKDKKSIVITKQFISSSQEQIETQNNSYDTVLNSSGFQNGSVDSYKSKDARQYPKSSLAQEDAQAQRPTPREYPMQDDMYENEATPGDVFKRIITTIETISEGVSEANSLNASEINDNKQKEQTSSSKMQTAVLVPSNSGTSSDASLAHNITQINLSNTSHKLVNTKKDENVKELNIDLNVGVDITKGIFIVGNAIDGYIKNAVVCLDLNGNGKCEIKEEPTTKTDEKGAYKLEITKEQASHKNFKKAMIVVVRGFDIDTGKRFEGKLMSVNNGDKHINVTPISTLVAKKVEKVLKKDKNITDEKIKKEIVKTERQVAKVLNIKEDEVRKDPVKLHEEGDEDLLKISLQVQKAVEAIVIVKKEKSKEETTKITEDVYEALANGLDEVSVDDESEEIVSSSDTNETTDDVITLQEDLNKTEDEVIVLSDDVNETTDDVITLQEDLNKTEDEVIVLGDDVNDTREEDVKLVLDENITQESNSGVELLLEKTKEVASKDKDVQKLLGGEDVVESIDIAKQVSKNVEIAFDEIDTVAEDKRHMIAVVTRDDLEKVEEAVENNESKEELSEKIELDDTREVFEDIDWEKKYIEDDLKFLDANITEGLVDDLKALLLTKHAKIKPGYLLTESDSVLIDSDDPRIAYVYKLILKERLAHEHKDKLDSTIRKNSDKNETVESTLDNSLGDTLQDEELLLEGVYYKVEDNKTSIFEFVFDVPQQGLVRVKEIGGDNAVSTSYLLKNNELDIPLLNYVFKFNKYENNYILFDGGKRMYYSLSDAQEYMQEFSDTNLTTKEVINSQ